MFRNFFAFFMLVFVLSCTNNNKKYSGVSLFGLGEDKKEITLRIDRFENDLFAANIDSLPSEIENLRKTYGEMFNIFNFKMVRLGDSNDPTYPEELKRFLTDYYMNLNYTEVQKVYPDIDDLTKQLNSAFGNYSKEFPKEKLPHIYTCVSGWNQSVVTSDTIIGISLDKYLGCESEYYKRLQYERYQIYTLQKDYIVSDCMRAWGYSRFEFSDSVCNSLLCNMLYEAKIIYFVKKMLPETHDTIIFGFKPSQLKWCNENESLMWTYLIEKKLLFTTKYIDIHKLVYPAPFTTFFSKESPGRAAVWLGLQIVNAYMDKHSDITLPQLMAENDYQKLLRESGFKP